MQEVEVMSKKLICYCKTVFWAKNSFKKKFKPFGLDPHPPFLSQVTEQHPSSPLPKGCNVRILMESVAFWNCGIYHFLHASGKVEPGCCYNCYN